MITNGGFLRQSRRAHLRKHKSHSLRQMQLGAGPVKASWLFCTKSIIAGSSISAGRKLNFCIDFF